MSEREVLTVLLRHRHIPAGWFRESRCTCGWEARRPTGRRDLTRGEQFAHHVTDALTAAAQPPTPPTTDQRGASHE